MSDIQVGDYVRTEKQGIRRIDTIFENRTVNKYGYEIGSEWDGKLYSIIKTTDITKHSPNLIDLIELGDYVNGERVLEKSKIKNNQMQICIYKDNSFSCWRTINDITLKDIVTHQQFNSVMYKVKE